MLNHRFRALLLAGLGCAALAGCATAPQALVQGLPPVAVTAVAETEPVGTANQDAADDPAIWRNPADPAQSLIVATDKKAGLYVYGMDGRRRGFVDGGLVNNVDLVEMGPDGGGPGVIVVASDRNDIAQAKLQVFGLDTAAAVLTPIGTVPAGPGEGYGLCLSLRGGELRSYLPVTDGRIYEQRLVFVDGASGGVRAEALRTLTVPSQPEGCVVDPRDGTLYVGEEAAGIWRFAPGASQGELVAPVDNRYLVADVEGLALAPEGSDGGYLVASSQGDNAYAVFRLPDMAPLGRFRIASGSFGATEETDGIELALGSFGPVYPGGLFVAQDGDNAPAAQNFKLVSWAAVKAALGLD